MSARDLPTTLERVAHLRHELRTPINAVLGYAEMLLEDTDAGSPAGLQDGLQQTVKLGKHLLDRISRLLGKEGVDEDVDLRELSLRLRTQLQEPTTKLIELADALLVIATANDLGGFADDLERIRTAGRRLADHIAEGFGSAMTPAELQASLPSRKPVTSPSAPEGAEDWKGNGQVLVVDDNAHNREILARHLYRQRNHFALAGDGIEALELLQGGEFDLVLLDVLMPRMNGVEVLKRLKADARLKEIPVIMISALDDMDGVVRCIELGAEDYLPKPFDPVLLRARVGACLEKKRLRDAELDYLSNVARVTDAAAALEKGDFDPGTLDAVAARPDHLGRLAAMFRQMAREVQAREASLRREVQALRIQIDEARKNKHVAEITESGYFQELQQRARLIKERGARKREQS
jgi:DNA-binding response OmpR family regulator